MEQMEPQLMTVSWTRKEILVAGFINGIVIGAFGDSVKSTQPGQWNDWMVVDDGVMGGLSQSSPVVTEKGTLVFSGHVSLENNGGFASIRHGADEFGLERGKGIMLRVKGDGKKYQLRLRTSDRFDGMAYKADFETKEGVWLEFRFPWNAFTATFRGRTIEEAPSLKPINIRQVGFLIADKQEGPFELEVQTLEVF
jgi:monofunctional biosynthetic peptidoglycan transglycosylase